MCASVPPAIGHAPAQCPRPAAPAKGASVKVAAGTSVPKTVELIGFLTAWTAGAPAAILLLTATARRRDSLRAALGPVPVPLAVETLAALSGAPV
jgi:hypothetical protein